MLPVLVPSVQLYELATVDDNVIAVVAPLHIVAVVLVLNSGVGLTVTVIVVAAPAHEPELDVGVTK